MSDNGAAQTVKGLLDIAGVKVNGTNPWDIQIHSDDTYSRFLADRSLGFGESYMDGKWNCDELDELICRLLRNDLEKRVPINGNLILQIFRSKLINLQSMRRAPVVGKKHYDVGNNLYATMLDKEMTYTCGYWKDAKTLDEAQIAKLDLVCRKIGLERGMRVLDIGCGWGSFARYAAKNFGVEVVGITISEEQRKLAEDRCRNLPIEIRFQDYRNVGEKFDRVISLGMFEHVGTKNYKEYMRSTHSCLADGGIAMLHTIAANSTTVCVDPWIERYIFPNSKLPSLKEITSAAEGLFVLEDCHNLGADYDKTLMAWHCNFNAGWNELKEHYDDRFRRMWNFYLLSCAGAFRARHLHVWQIVMSKGGIAGGYNSIR